MARVEAGQRDEELQRWEIHHPPERIAENTADEAAFVRIARREPHPGSPYLTIFRESDPPDTPRDAMVLWPDVLDELIADLQACRAVVRGEQD